VTLAAREILGWKGKTWRTFLGGCHRSYVEITVETQRDRERTIPWQYPSQLFLKNLARDGYYPDTELWGQH
jgi:hypothetical protein